MKSKQANMIAKLGEQVRNGNNLNGSKTQVACYSVIDKKTEKDVVLCRCWMSRSSSASVVYASIWVNGKDYGASGYGKASGGGYHKESAAIQEAITSAGIKLYGSAYSNSDRLIDFKKQAYIDGVGDSAIQTALLAIAYAAGSRDVLFANA